MSTQAIAVGPSLRRAFIAVFGTAFVIPLLMAVLAAISFILLFYLESILIGAYPFLGSVRVGKSPTTFAVAFPFNWLLTIAQWGAYAVAMASWARARGNTNLGDHVILTCGLWFATNVFVRLSFLVFGLEFVTTPVRM
jgi:hypothetical protein